PQGRYGPRPRRGARAGGRPRRHHPPDADGPRHPLPHRDLRPGGVTVSADHRLAPTLEDETERAAAAPPPLWGRDRVGGNPKPRISGFPPPLAPPHKGEGNPLVSDPEGLTPL